jgi:D-erythro-7,8-dihydroneopterin triphosphate epimerase
MDKIIIKDLLARCIIGVNDDERREKQDVVITIAISADLKKACVTDDFNDTVDYRAIKKTVLSIVESSRYYLVEALAERIAQACLEFNGVSGALVQVEKPSALRFARSVGVEIYRERE